MANTTGYGYLLGPAPQFFDANGKPLVGGKLFVYIAGTTTTAVTYSDFNRTENTSPVILNDIGSCILIVPSANLYKIVLYDRKGNLLITRDNVSVSIEYQIIYTNANKVESSDSTVDVTETTDTDTGIITYDLSIKGEIDRATEAEKGLADAIETEKNRAEEAERTLSESISEKAGTASPLMDGKASVGNSLKYAREDHVHPSDTSREDIANKTTVVLGTSDSKYPTDKAVADFVNSSIATNTANYISNNGEPFTSVEQLEAYSGPVTNNDYAFVTGIDSEGNTYYDRYKATVSGSTVTWALEYRLNNSSFTAAQWSAINSGITSALVAKIHEHSNKDVLDGITSSDVANWNSKQNRLTFDTTPTAGSNNPVTSDGIKTAISNSVDQTYSSISTNAQSGVAVNEAFKTRETSGSDDSYTYLGMQKTFKGTESLYWKLVSFKTVNNFWTLQFEVDVSNGRKGDASYDTEIYETKRLTICGIKPGTVRFASELRYVAQGIDSSRGYGNNIYYEIGKDNLVTVYIKAIDSSNKTQLCRLKDVINFKGISNITWHEPVNDAGTQPTNPVKFKEVFPAIASTASDIGSDSVPVYVNRGKPVACNSSNLKAGKDDDGNVIKNTYQKKLTFDTTPTAGSTNPVTSDGIKTALEALQSNIDTADAKGIVINEINGENVICFE